MTILEEKNPNKIDGRGLTLIFPPQAHGIIILHWSSHLILPPHYKRSVAQKSPTLELKVMHRIHKLVRIAKKSILQASMLVPELTVL